jgi:hypothetical protein
MSTHSIVSHRRLGIGQITKVGPNFVVARFARGSFAVSLSDLSPVRVG